MEQKGLITKTEERTTQSGKTYGVITVAGSGETQDYSIWNDKVFGFCKARKGQGPVVVKYEINERGYRNVKHIGADPDYKGDLPGHEDTAQGEAQAEPAPAPRAAPAPDRNTSIEAQEIMKDIGSAMYQNNADVDFEMLTKCFLWIQAMKAGNTGQYVSTQAVVRSEPQEKPKATRAKKAEE